MFFSNNCYARNKVFKKPIVSIKKSFKGYSIGKNTINSLSKYNASNKSKSNKNVEDTHNNNIIKSRNLNMYDNINKNKTTNSSGNYSINNTKYYKDISSSYTRNTIDWGNMFDPSKNISNDYNAHDFINKQEKCRVLKSKIKSLLTCKYKI